jgi:23S rRNA pseudouridine1911/1915/1917 synthase
MSQQNKHSKINILFEDESIIAINKPSQLLVIPDRWDPNKPSLISILQDRYPGDKIYVVHRLVKDTSGVILFARTAAAHKHLCQQMEQRQVTKKYFAIVKGEVEHDGIVNLNIDTDRGRRGTVTIHRKGKESSTEYKIVERFKGFTYLEVIPRTGRTHQVRVHLQAIGHPLAIDPLYGDNEPIYLSKLKRNYRFKPDQEERPLIDRLTLHAAEILVTHPLSHQPVTIAAELPKDMRVLLNVLAKYRPLSKKVYR